MDTSSARCPFTDVIGPAQSYLSNVLDAVSVCTSERNSDRLPSLQLDFDTSSFAATYNPWLHVNTFGRQSFYKSLLKSFNTPIVNTFGQVSPVSSTASSSGEKGPRKLPKRAKLQPQFGNASNEERKKAAEDLIQCSSKS